MKCGEWRIRTSGTREGPPVFKTGAFDRSANSPHRTQNMEHRTILYLISYYVNKVTLLIEIDKNKKGASEFEFRFKRKV